MMKAGAGFEPATTRSPSLCGEHVHRNS